LEICFGIWRETMISGSLSPRHGASSGCGWRNSHLIWRVAANTLKKQSRAADKGWSSSFGVGRGANNSSPISMDRVFNYIAGKVFFMLPPLPLLHYLAKIRKEIWQSYAALLVDLPCFRTALAVRQDVCCSCLTSCCKYALFSFLKRRLKDQIGKRINQ
jgi:hypothetical protein